jgi:chromosome segregation ATPase
MPEVTADAASSERQVPEETAAAASSELQLSEDTAAAASYEQQVPEETSAAASSELQVSEETAAAASYEQPLAEAQEALALVFSTLEVTFRTWQAQLFEAKAAAAAASKDQRLAEDQSKVAAAAAASKDQRLAEALEQLEKEKSRVTELKDMLLQVGCLSVHLSFVNCGCQLSMHVGKHEGGLLCAVVCDVDDEPHKSLPLTMLFYC